MVEIIQGFGWLIAVGTAVGAFWYLLIACLDR